MAEELIFIVEDDATFGATLARSFERRGYKAMQVHSLDSLAELLQTHAPRYAVVDLKLKGASGLAYVEALHARDSQTTIVVLTGFASIATAVEAIKLGASHYLTKPSSTDDIEAAFHKHAGNTKTPISVRPTSIKTLEWEHIHQVLMECGFNISEAARRLGMHRRTLARKLEKQRLK